MKRLYARTPRLLVGEVKVNGGGYDETVTGCGDVR